LFLFEKTYVATGTPAVIGKPRYYDASIAELRLHAEAQLVANAVLHGGMGSQRLMEGLGKTGWNLFLVPQFRLRGVDANSGPVQSISFMPRFVLQRLRTSGGSLDAPTSGRRVVTGINLVLGHHSNGGSTCNFRDEDVQNNCAPPAAKPPAGQREYWVNDDNFSTNYIEVGLGRRVGELVDEGAGPYWRDALDVMLSAQANHNMFGLPLPGGATSDFRSIYGANRIRLDVAWHRVFRRSFGVRVSTRYDHFDPPEERFQGARNYTWESDILVQRVAIRKPVSRLTSLIPVFVGVGYRYSRGQDYYNTQFVRDISFHQFAVFISPWTASAGAS
jgi:hypothetical protein